MGWEVVVSSVANVAAVTVALRTFLLERRGRQEAQRASALHAAAIRSLLPNGQTRVSEQVQLAALRVLHSPSREKILTATGAAGGAGSQAGLLEALAQRELEVRRELSELPETNPHVSLHGIKFTQHGITAGSTAYIQLPPPRPEPEATELLDVAQNPDSSAAIANVITTLNEVFERLGPPPASLRPAGPTGGNGGNSQ
ncbi:hypothetical protein [Streptomyces sp. WM6373]|uniref:hypothetical protein n=1 Tax=Streptomyces sp. WM6373 TaxID=1415556 RepID=UPI00131B5DB3|nr:hypothetical protein [Streptomyces sp. WM6373]